MRSWSLRPPYVRFGAAPSWTVANDRDWELAGSETRVRAFTEVADWVVVLDSIAKVGLGAQMS